MKTTIIIPWIRENLIENVRELAIKNAGIPENEIDLQSVRNKPGYSVNKLFNEIVSKTKSDYVCFLADDTLPQPDYLKNALEAFKNGVKFVMMNDGTNTDRPGHFVFKRDLLPLLGGKLATEGYQHCYADNEIIDRTRELGVYKWCKEALVIHNHPMLNKEVPMDEYYNKAYSQQVMNKDLALYVARKTSGWPDSNEGLKTELKVGIGLPSLGEIKTETTKFLMELYSNMKFFGMNPLIINAYAPVETARNLIAEKALENDCTHLLFVDYDATCQANAAHMLLMEGKQIIGCNAAKKISEEPVLLRNVNGEDLDYIRNQIDEVPSIGMHVTLINTDVFRNMEQPFFQPVPFENNPVLATEDLVFCKKSGEKIYCHLGLSVVTGHVVFRDKIVTLEKHIRKQMEEAKKTLEPELDCDDCHYYTYYRCHGYDCNHEDASEEDERGDEPLAENRKGKIPLWCPKRAVKQTLEEK
jgi:hypothetical protein